MGFDIVGSMKWCRWFLTGLMALVVASPVWADEPHATLALGSPAPAFSLPGVDGKVHKLSDYAKAKVLAVVFTCNHCPTAQLYETRLKKLADEYNGRGVAFIAIQPNNPDAIRLDELGYTDVSDTLADMKIRAAYRHFNFPYLYDGDTQKVSLAYGPKATPHAFVFDHDRKLRYEGRVDNNQREQLVKTQDLKNAIDALLADKAVPVDHTGVFGCSTKWISKQAGRETEAKKIATEPVNLEMATPEELKKIRANGTGKVVLVNFWATWCGPCVHEMPQIEETYRMFRGRDFDLTMISTNVPDEKPAVVKMLQKMHASSRNLLFASDDTYALQAAFDPKWDSGVPYTAVLAPDGKVLYQENGEVDILKLRRVVLANLPDENYKGHREYWAASLSQ